MDEIFELLREVESAASAYMSGSELYELNTKAHEAPVTVSDMLYRLIELGAYYGTLTDGAFDITLGKLTEIWGIGTGDERVPEQAELNEILPHIGYENIVLDSSEKSVYFKTSYVKIDLGGIAKGYAADEIRNIIIDYGIENAVVDLGGNITVIGDNNGKGWRVGITDPLKPSAQCEFITVSDVSIVTSGNYERYFIKDGTRYHHILDRTTGYPSESGVISATIVTESSAAADALSTALFVLGAEEAEKLAEEIGVTALLIDSGGNKSKTGDVFN